MKHFEKMYFEKIAACLKDVQALNELYTELIQKRTEALPKMQASITIDTNSKRWADSIIRKNHVLNFAKPLKSILSTLVKKIQDEKLVRLGKSKFKPWDTAVNPNGKAPLKPFKSGQEMLDKTITTFSNDIDSKFAGFLKTMEQMKHFDLESKPGKAPGGYNYPLYETGAPFCLHEFCRFSNDFTTMVHEGGHAVHSFLTHELEVTSFKSFPSEIAEKFGLYVDGIVDHGLLEQSLC